MSDKEAKGVCFLPWVESLLPVPETRLSAGATRGVLLERSTGKCETDKRRHRERVPDMSLMKLRTQVTPELVARRCDSTLRKQEPHGTTKRRFPAQRQGPRETTERGSQLGHGNHTEPQSTGSQPGHPQGHIPIAQAPPLHRKWSRSPYCGGEGDAA